MSGPTEQDDEEPGEAPLGEPTRASELRTVGLLDELLDVEPRARDIAAGRGAAAHELAELAGETVLGTRVGRFVDWRPGAAPRVEFVGNTRGPLAARSVIPLTPAEVAEAIAEERGVLLSFDGGRADAPIITGVLQALLHPEPEPAPESESESEPESVSAQLPEGDTLETHVDGRRVEIEAADEIVLRCGEASIVLRRNGRVVIRGTYVETRSRGVNRIKGGSVEIN